MLFKDIAIVNENFEIEEHKYVGVKGEFIDCIADAMPQQDYGEEYNGRGKLLLPAFYNTHSHLPMAILRGYAENLALMDWLQGRIFPFEAKLTPDDIYYGTLMGVAEMYRYGIAGTTEMYIQQEPLGRAFLESGAKANFCVSTIWMGNESYFDLPYYKEATENFKRFNGANNGRMIAEFCIHAEYTSTERIVKEAAGVAAEYGAGMHIHASETRSEVDLCRKRHQRRSPIRYMYDCGIFEVPTTAAHCVHIDDEDVAILKEKNVTVATCPKSNAKLASGICPVESLLKAGVNVAIGTDSVASNNNLNMIEEMRFFNLLQKGVEVDPTVITPAQTLYAATRAGAISQRRMDCGLVKEGFRADLAVMDVDTPSMKPVYNLLNNLVYAASGSDIVLTMVDGDVMYRDGAYTTLDIERIEYELDRRKNRILAELDATQVPDLEEL